MHIPDGTRTASPRSGASVGEAVREISVQPRSAWRWLEELRFRFDLGIDVLDRDLHPILSAASDMGSSVELRAALSGPLASILREGALAALRSARPRSVSVGALRLRISPLFTGTVVPRAVVALLLVSETAAAGADLD